MNKERDINIFIKEYSKEIEENNAAVFAGAGLSVPAGYVNWKELLKPLAEEIGLNVEKENDLISLAQFHCNEHGGTRGRINQLLINELNKKAQETENHRIFSRLPISTYWTTNADKLIEKSLESTGKNPDVKFTVNQLAITKPKRDAIVYKMHGDADHPDQAILIKDDYETYHLKMSPFITTLSGDLVSKTFLFIGFSFTDPNLDYILSRVRATYNKHQRQHYCFMKSVSNNEESEVDSEYKKRKQELFINDLKRFSIKTILIDSYTEITIILKRLEQIWRQKTVFISGSAYEYGDWSRHEAERFISKLSQTLVKSNYKIVSGFGLGVGSAVITGALEEIYINQRQSVNDKLIIKPFPQSDPQDTNLEGLWEKYRKDMISLAGTAIFVFGNKLLEKESQIIEARGVEREFEIALEKELNVIPVGATGYVAAKLWEKVINNFESYYSNSTTQLKEAFQRLNNQSSSSDSLISEILNIINLLRAG